MSFIRNSVEFLTIFVILVLSEAQDTCIDPFLRMGACVSIQDCPSLLTVLKRRVSYQEKAILRQSQCGWEGHYPQVCCAGIYPTSGFANKFQDGFHFPSDPVLTTLATPKPRRAKPSKPSKGESLLPSVGQCGVQISNKIFGGTKVEFDEYPWLALLEYAKPDGSRGVHCGGALISDSYVITAAHCIPRYGNSRFRLMNVHLGEYDVRTSLDCDPDDPSVCADPIQIVPVAKEIPHEGYDTQNLNNDIALLRLARKVKFTHYVKPICLPTDPALKSSEITVRQEFDVAGWGKTEFGYKSPIKLKVRVSGVTNEECAQTYLRSQSPKKIGKEQLCAGGERGKDSCNGDSGGPLMGYYKDSQGRAYFYLAGIVSFGPQECGLAGWPGVYTRITEYIPWIKSKLRS